jgi:hypothetical protein
MLAAQFVRGPLSTTQWWYALADFLLASPVDMERRNSPP